MSAPTSAITPVTAEQETLRTVCGQFLARSWSLDTLRATVEWGHDDPGAWTRLVGELGLSAIGIPEQYGGVGSGVAELALVAEQQGRVLHRSPFLASACMAARAILHVATAQEREELLPGFADGTRVGALVCPELGSSDDHGSVSARVGDDEARLEGSGLLLGSALLTDLLVVATDRDDEDRSLYLVDVGQSAVTRIPGPVFDTSRWTGQVEFDGARARRLGDATEIDDQLDRVVADARTCLAADALGGAQACLDMTVDYTRVRHQFDRPIGSFQALKHQCADLQIELELAGSALARAVQLSGDTVGASVWSAIAKASASEAFARIARASIQIHGGIGFTWEHDAHLYYRRAATIRPLLGAPDDLYESLAGRGFDQLASQAGGSAPQGAA